MKAGCTCRYVFNCSKQADILKLMRLHHMALSEQIDGTLAAAHPSPFCTQVWRNLRYNGQLIIPDMLLDLRQYTLPLIGAVSLDYVSFKVCPASVSQLDPSGHNIVGSGPQQTLHCRSSPCSANDRHAKVGGQSRHREKASGDGAHGLQPD